MGDVDKRMKPGLCPDMPFIAADWLSSTAISLMTPAQEGAYIRLLCHAWNTADCSLPGDDESLAVLSRLGDAWATDGQKIKACFEADPENPGRIYNAKQRSIREEQDRRVMTAQEHGRRAINARWSRSKNDTRVIPENYSSNTRVIPEGIPKNTSSLVPRPSSLIESVSDTTAVCEAAIPTLEEVKTLADMRAIPGDYATNFWNYHQNNQLWLNKHNRMIDWRSMIVTYWAKDRQSWADGTHPAKKSNPEKPGTSQPSESAKRIAEAAKRRSV